MNPYVFEPIRPVVQTKFGKLRGVTYGDINIFMGVEYAKAKRFHMPEEPQTWEGIMKARRSGELLALSGRQSVEFRRRYIGRNAQVLLEESRDMGGRTYFLGHTRDYVKVAIDAEDSALGGSLAINRLVEVPVRGFLTDEILM